MVCTTSKAAAFALSSKNEVVDSYFHIIIGQLVNLYKDGEPIKMSKRTGDDNIEVITDIGSMLPGSFSIAVKSDRFRPRSCKK